MGKSLPSTSKLYQFTKMATPKNKSQKPNSQNHNFNPESSSSINGDHKLKLKMESPAVVPTQPTIPLSDMVSDCVRRWFQDTLKEAKAGDTSMQVLVGQMYYSGYGTPRDAQKGKIWITKASRTRSSALKVGDKRPGYNVSDSDSDDDANEMK